MPSEVLVHRIRLSDLHHQARLPSPAHAPRALPERGLGARVADQHGHVEGADVDPELEGVGADDHLDLSRAQAGLDLAPQQRQVATAVAADLVGAQAQVPGRFLQVTRQHLHRRSPATEEDRLVARPDEVPRKTPGLLECVGAQARHGIEQRRRIDREDAPPLRRGVAVDDLHGAAEQALGMPRAVAQGGRTAQKARLPAVVTRDAQQSTQDVGHARSEHAREGVDLVDHDRLEVTE